MSDTRRRRRPVSPVVERRRRQAVQWTGLAVLALVTAVLVLRALQTG